jgi:hypothetical protein
VNARIINSVLGGLVLSALGLGCVGSVALIDVWSDPGYHAVAVDNVLVVGMAPRLQSRSVFEYQLAHEFNANGVNAMASLDGMPADEEISRDAFEEYFRDLNLDAVLVTALVRADTTKIIVPGNSYEVQSGYYRDFWGEYHTQWTVHHEPGYIQETTEYLIESTLYETSEGKVIWRGVSRAVDPDQVSVVIEDLSKILVKRLGEDGMIVLKKEQ